MPEHDKESLVSTAREKIEESIEHKIEERKRREPWFKAVTAGIVLLLILIVLFLIQAYRQGEFRSVETLQAYIRSFKLFAPLIFLLYQAVQVVIPVLPGFIGCAVGALLFGPVLGFTLNYVGICGGSIIAFALAKTYGAPLLEKLFPMDKYQKWTLWAAKSKSYSLFFFVATLLPLTPDDYLCYLSGLTHMSYRRFLILLLLGKPWLILAYSFGFSLLK